MVTATPKNPADPQRSAKDVYGDSARGVDPDAVVRRRAVRDEGIGQLLDADLGVAVTIQQLPRKHPDGKNRGCRYGMPVATKAWVTKINRWWSAEDARQGCIDCSC